MLAALLLAGVCASPPLFGELDGPICAPERQSIECGCNECMTWDPDPGAVYYQVDRITVSSGAVYRVGAVPPRVWIDEETGQEHVELPTTWCFGRDAHFPREGVLYAYRVRSCNTTTCAAWSATVDYRAAPYACFDGGREVQCYVGDSLVTR